VIRGNEDFKIDFSPAKLKAGFGPEVIWTLNVLSDVAMKHSSQQLNEQKGSRSKNTTSSVVVIKGLTTTEPLEDGDEASNEDDDDLEINFDEALFEDEEEEQVTLEGEDSFQSIHSRFHTKNKTFSETSLTQNRDILMSKTEDSSWKREVERVLPQLKVVVRSSDVKTDWRMRLNHFRSSKRDLEKEMEMSNEKLGRLMKEISQNMDKVVSREKYLQQQFEPLLSEYSGLQSRRNVLLDSYETASAGISQKSRVLSSISDELESIKSEMEERGSSMTDGTPLVSLRKALQKIKTEVTTIDVRIGVATHTILEANLKDSLLQNYIQRGRMVGIGGGHEHQDSSPLDSHRHLF